VRVLLFNQYFYPDASATSQLLAELTEDLSEDHDIWVVCGRPSYNPIAETASRGFLSRERFGKVRILRVWSTAFYRASFAGRILNYLTYLAGSAVAAFAAPRPDVVVALTDPPQIGLVGALAARVRGAPFVLVVKDISPEAAVIAGKLRNPLVIRAQRWVSDAILRAADRIVSIGRDMTRRLTSLGVPEDKIVLINDWTDGRLVRPGPSAFREEQGWGDAFVVMHSGNVGYARGLDTVLDAAEMLLPHDDIVIAIVGDGSRKAELVAEADRRGLHNVQFLPFQPKERLGELLTAADVHLVCHERGMSGYQVPSKIYGILAAGKPTIAAVEEGAEVTMILEEAGCGVRVEPDDAEALAKAILECRSLPLDEMGAAARAAFEERFDRPRAVRRYRELLRSIGGS
jgi:glycosyltransferase involved in cell wall biosynthesis